MVKPGPIIGTSGNDWIEMSGPYSFRKQTSAQGETIYGGDGNDTIYGLGGNDVLYGDRGDRALPDNSIIGDNNDTLYGGDGDDTIYGEEGNDNLNGDNGADRMFGGDGDDRMMGGAGDDVLYGGNGADSMFGGDGNDTILGEAGDDTLRGGNGADRIFGGDGNDTLYGGPDNDFIDGGAGIDIVNFLSSPVVVDLGAGTAFGDGSDALVSIEGVVGSSGNDLITGDGAANALYGGDGADRIFGGGGNDTILGEAGDDSLNGGDGDDSINGGIGFDIVTFNRPVVVDLGAGTATGEGTDTLVGIEAVVGSIGNDSITGDGGPNSLTGRDGDDTINGGDGTDTAIYRGAWVDYRITDVGGTTTLIDNRGGSPDGADTVTGVEMFQFANGTFTAAQIVNDAPAAVADSATAREAGGVNNGTPGIDPTGNVLTNDTDPDSGLGDTKTVQGVAAGATAGPLGSGVGVTVVGSYGGLVLQANGAYAYTLDNGNPTVEALNPGDHLTDVFTYTMKDAAGQTSTTTLTVTIDGATDTPGNTIVGDDGANTLVGTGGDDSILGLGGDDTLFGGAGNDFVDGGDGNNRIAGDSGDDAITSGSGDDVITGDEYAALAYGYYWSPCTGGGACDAVSYPIPGFIVGGNETISGGDGSDIIYGDQFTATAHGLYGYGGSIVGGNDTIAGGGGDDTIHGDGASASTPDSYGTGRVYGGDDVITGGAGRDLLYGDWGSVATDSEFGGNDTFVYLSTGDGGDTIADFGALGEDLIDVSAIDANTAAAGDQAFGFAGTVAANFSIWYSDNGTDTTLYFDNSGDASADMSIVLLGVNGTDLSLADFVA